MIHRLHHEKENGHGYQHERDERVEKFAVRKLAAVDAERQRTEVDLSRNRNERGEQILDQRGDDGTERGAHDDADREVDNVASQQKCPEFLQHSAETIARGCHNRTDMAEAVQRQQIPRWARPGRVFSRLGPGLVTGAADDDPSGIATYSQTGAQFGYGQLWTVLLLYPCLVAIQEACGRIGEATGRGLADTLGRHYSRRLLRSAVLILLLANVINIGADIGAVAPALRLLIPLPAPVFLVSFVILTLLLEIAVGYHRYARYLKILTLGLLAYAITALIVAESWSEILRATFVPHIEFSLQFFYVITAVFGTTITPYCFFWQTSQEAEEVADKRSRHRTVRDVRLDTLVGMGYSQLAQWWIIVTCATVLHGHGVTDIPDAATAAEALQPLAGTHAELLFALGIIALGFLAVPILAGSSSYAVAELMGWREGLDLPVRQARGFYAVIITATVVGLGLNFLGVNPLRALVFSAVVNGVVAVPLIWMIGHVATNRKIMGEAVSGRLSRAGVALTFVAMAASAIALFVSLIVR